MKQTEPKLVGAYIWDEPNTIIHVEGGGAIVMWRQRHVLFSDLEYLLGVSKPRYPMPVIP